MRQRETPLSFKLLLITIFFAGLALNLLVFLDVHWWGYYLVPRTARTPTDTGTVVEPARLEQLRESILLVLVPTCDGARLGSGTGFVIKPGYIATAAHVIGDHYACESEIRLVDSYGVEHAATAEGYSDADDLAILRITDTSIPSLRLADSRQFQEINDVVEVVTIGYPVVGEASAYDSAAVSGDGNISRFDAQDKRFVTSGLNVNPGNSGGPVFLKDSWMVVGIASAKMDVTVAEGIGYVIPVNILKQFFNTTTGDTLE